MANKIFYDFFPGALAQNGFSGWFEQIMQEEPQQVYLIKAGPGCGKSTFMRTLAQTDDAYCDTRGVIERLHCSSDPKSLDGVRLSDCSALVLDATAPHTVDCVYPDAAQSVLSFYDTLDHVYLRKNSAQVLALGKRNTSLLSQAAGHFGIACSLLARRRKAAAGAVNGKALHSFAVHLAKRTMPLRKAEVPGLQRHRLLSAPTPNKPTVFYDTIPQIAPRCLYAIHDNYGAVSSQLLAVLAEHARTNGYDAYLCHCPTAQKEKLDHLFIPELGLGFVTANSFHPMLFAHQKNIYAKRFMELDAFAPRKALLSWQKRLADELIDRTCALQAEARSVHDEMEKYYIAATDFCGVENIRIQLEQELFE